MSTYTRPDLTAEQQMDAMRAAGKIIGNHSIAQIRAAVVALCAENIRLAVEINDHRAAGGFEPLPTFKP